MKRITRIILTSLTLLLACCAEQGGPVKPLVVTSIAPLGDWIGRIGGSDIDVLVLIPPSSSPHTFELSPGQLRDASRAALVVLNGAGLEYWSDRLIDNLRDERTPVITLSDGVALLQTGEHHDGEHHDQEHMHGNAGNPHIWLDPGIAAASVQRISDALTALLPEKRDSIAARTTALLADLEALDGDIAAEVRHWRRHRFIGDHSSWLYFARRYGLEEAGVIESVPGREVSAREMTSLIEMMRRENIAVVFADRRKSPRAADILSEETHAKVAQLDPMGTAGDGYVSMMRSNIAEMAKVMR